MGRWLNDWAFSFGTVVVIVILWERNLKEEWCLMIA